MLKITENQQKLKDYKFIDLFAGIGGFHYALKSFGAECVFASEIDKKAQNTYYSNHDINPYGDITQINEKDIPKHDIMCGGFPCQAFSISGKQKGFKDTRGTLFFDIARIVAFHKPRILFLENVKNFTKHDNGNTLKIVIDTLTGLDYTVQYKVLNTSNFGLPQNRERVYIIAFHNSYANQTFDFPSPNIKLHTKKGVAYHLKTIFMLFGLLQFWFAQNIFGDIGTKPVKVDSNAVELSADEPKLNPFTSLQLGLIAIAGVLGISWIFNDPILILANWTLCTISGYSRLVLPHRTLTINTYCYQ